MSTPGAVREAEQLPRFGPLRPAPPAEILDLLTGAVPGTGWTADRIGNEDGYPNGGLWRVEADHRRPDGPAAVYVKRTGAAHLGTFRVWRLQPDPTDPQWWGREAEFYQSELATSGWTGDVRVARCVVDDHDGCRDLWLEEVAGIPAPLEMCRRAVAGLARWQVGHAASDHPWLADGWIAAHVGRYELDNERTLAHPAWPAMIERGLDPALRDLVAARVVEPAGIARLLSEFPRALTHHDFHDANVGTVGDQVVIIDWAYVGWGPIGHDVGHLALSLDPAGSVDPAVAWQILETAYCDALDAAGWSGDLGIVRRSMVVSNQLRLGWCLDALLDAADKITDDALAVQSRMLTFLGELR
jgi:hypothetical protein